MIRSVDTKTCYRTFIVLLLAIGCFAEQGQIQSPAADSSFHPFKVNRWVSGGIIGAGLIGDYFLVPKILDKKNLTDAELQGLNRNVYLNSFDHWALTLDPSKRSTFENYSNYTSVTIYGLPLLLAFDKNIRRNWLDLLFLYLETHAVTFSIYNLSFMGPTFQNKYRPIAYYDELPFAQRSSGNNRNSMYSGHVASSTAASFFMAKVYIDYHPEMGWKKYLLYGAASVPPLFLGYLRVRALDHFPSDVGVGFMVGALCGVLVPEIHRIKDRTISIGSLTTPDGGSGLCVKWELIRQRKD
jgi:membrane-associated phospholipid phosphatase